MNALLDQLGINLPLFVSQIVNFFILLAMLTFFVYKPLIRVIKKRNAKIKEGLEKAEEADVRLKEVDIIAGEKLKKADQESIQIIQNTENKAKVLEQSLQKKAEDHQKELMRQIELNYKNQQEETKKLVFSEALELVKKTLIKTVELKPEAVDEALIKKAVSQVKEQ